MLTFQREGGKIRELHSPGEAGAEDRCGDPRRRNPKFLRPDWLRIVLSNCLLEQMFILLIEGRLILSSHVRNRRNGGLVQTRTADLLRVKQAL